MCNGLSSLDHRGLMELYMSYSSFDSDIMTCTFFRSIPFISTLYLLNFFPWRVVFPYFINELFKLSFIFPYFL